MKLRRLFPPLTALLGVVILVNAGIITGNLADALVGQIHAVRTSDAETVQFAVVAFACLLLIIGGAILTALDLGDARTQPRSRETH